MDDETPSDAALVEEQGDSSTQQPFRLYYPYPPSDSYPPKPRPWYSVLSCGKKMNVKDMHLI